MTPGGGTDPRAALLFTGLACAALLAAPPLRALVLAAPLLVAAARAAGRDGVGPLLRTVVLVWGATVAANAFLVPGTRLGPEALGWLRPTAEGVEAGWRQGARLAGLTAAGAWGLRTVSALELASAAEWTVRRAPRLRAAVHRAVFPMVLATRLVPLLVEEASRVRAVARLRGDRRGLRRAAAWVPAWIQAVLDRADALARALRLRGYHPGRPLSFARRFRFGARDWALTATGVAALAWGAL